VGSDIRSKWPNKKWRTYSFEYFRK